MRANVLNFTLASIILLSLATWGLAPSVSALWYTPFKILYVCVVGSNALLFMASNNVINRTAGACLLGLLLFPISEDKQGLSHILHHVFAIAFFIIKPLRNERSYDLLAIIVVFAANHWLGFSLYQGEIAAMTTLVAQGKVDLQKVQTLATIE